MTARMLNAMSNDTVQTLYQRLVVVFVIPQLHTLPRAACDAAVRRLDDLTRRGHPALVRLVAKSKPRPDFFPKPGGLAV